MKYVISLFFLLYALECFGYVKKLYLYDKDSRIELGYTSPNALEQELGEISHSQDQWAYLSEEFCSALTICQDLGLICDCASCTYVMQRIKEKKLSARKEDVAKATNHYSFLAGSYEYVLGSERYNVVSTYIGCYVLSLNRSEADFVLLWDEKSQMYEVICYLFYQDVLLNGILFGLPERLKQLFVNFKIVRR